MLQISPQKKKFLQLSLIGVFFLLTAFFVFFLFRYLNTPDTLNQEIKNFQKGGEQALSDLTTLPSVNLTEEEESYTIEDTLSEGIEITYPNQVEDAESIEANKPKTKVSLPKDYTKPIEIKLDNERIITIQDENNQGYTADTLSAEMTNDQLQISNQSLFSKIFPKKVESTQSYLRYQNDRKTLLYSYQRDRATGERKLKHWTFYEEGTGEEKESYKVENATLKKNENGDVELFFQTEQDLKNQAAAKEVDPSLMDRAMRTLEKEGVNQNQNPDLLIPRPYYYDKDGNYQEAEWEVQENKLILNIKTTKDKYPLSVDPTLAFTAPGVSSGGWVIDGAYAEGLYRMKSGDFNSDSKTDLVVASSNSYIYIFYNDGAYAEKSSKADVVIYGTDGGNFGQNLVVGDFNADSRPDLAVGASAYSSSTGRAYIFYNDGSYPITDTTADVKISGEAASGFGAGLEKGDLNADGKTDLVVGANLYSSSTGRAYVFYNDGSIPTTAATADVIITGEATTNYFGQFIEIGDLNADGETDLIIGGWGYSTNTGRAYIFYNDGAYPTTAATADVIITGEASSSTFGINFASGDMNADGESDLIVSAKNYSSSTGRIYIFYNDGAYPTTAATADGIITGAATLDAFGETILVEDLNADGRKDIVATATLASSASNSGRIYVFYNDSSIPTAAASADMIINSQRVGDYLGSGLTTGDFNADGKTDLAATARDHATFYSKAYIFYSQNGVLNTNKNIAGEAGSGLGSALVAGDFNADGRVDLVVGANTYSSNAGRTYIFYNDGSIPTTAATADVIISGEASSYFGVSLAAGDLNSDGRVDLAVGSSIYTTNTGRTYIFYNDGSIPTTAATADVIITGESTGNYFGTALTTGDFNADGRVDLAGTAFLYGSVVGRAYIFYNDGSIPTTAATADVIISGESLSTMGRSIRGGDLNADGKVDLVIGADGYSSSTGRTYIFYNDGSIPTTAATADVIIVGETSNNYFGQYFTIGDLNADGRADLIVSAYGYSSNTGRVYAFYNDGSIPTTAATADVTITGGATADQFGDALITGDFNTDGRTDLAIGADLYSSTVGRAYVFYNDGSMPTTAATADVTITGEGGYFGNAFTVGDFNADGKVDLVVAAAGGAGKVHFYEGQDNYAWTLQSQPLGTNRINPQGGGEELRITGATTSDYFGTFVGKGDFNADGKDDLVVSSVNNITSFGRVYIFYNDGNYPSGATNADVIITDNVTNRFGSSLAVSDFNADGRVDLAVGAITYSSNAGRAYIFYNDGSIPTTAATADVFIDGEASSSFGLNMMGGDLNADGKADLIIATSSYTTNTGRAYIFYNDGSIPTTAATADVIITGQATSSYFGLDMTVGDLNTDGKVDLVVGASPYSGYLGRAYIFYNDGSIPTTAATADVIITGDASSGLGSSLATGDFNADGRVDLGVGASEYSGGGRAYIFYNDGSIPTTAATADVTILGEGGNFGHSMTAGDLNADGKTDLIVSAYSYGGSAGRVYVFHNDGSIPTTAATADVMITGEDAVQFGIRNGLVTGDFNADGKADLVGSGTSFNTERGRVYLYTFNDSVTGGGTTGDEFGIALASADLNADGKVDLVVGASGYSTSTGRAYIFYGGSALDTSVSNADIVITGEASSSFGRAFTVGDFNVDGKTDLVVGANTYSTSTGRVYIFYNDGSIPTTAATADVIITGEGSSAFGQVLATGDLNVDSKADLIAGANTYSTSTGRVYIFYSDGSIPTTAATADVIITGEATNNYFGYSLAVGDMNADGKVDLAGGARGYSTNTGRVYIFYNDGSIPTTAATADVTITGEATFNYLGVSVVTGDFNADGRVDLAVGSHGYSSGTGRVYIFYNDGSIPTTAATADVTITGAAPADFFGYVLAVGNLNIDGKVDLAVESLGYSSSTGRVYVFYNDQSFPETADSADKIYTGETTNSSFGIALIVSDLNFDGISDLGVGAYGYSSYTGRVYTFITEIVATQTETKAAEFKGSSGVIKGSFELK